MQLLVLLGVLSLVHGYPDGPPAGACLDMKPGTQVGTGGLEGHLSLPQNVFPTYGNPREPPYYMTISPDVEEYTPGQVYYVTITANQTAGHNFYKGILLQARPVDCFFNSTIRVHEDIVGRFDVSSPTNQMLQYMDCEGGERNTISHRSPMWKLNETVSWTAPDSRDYGDIVFRATIVKDYMTHWTEVHSKIMRAVAIQPPRTCGSNSLHQSVYIITLLVFMVTRL